MNILFFFLSIVLASYVSAENQTIVLISTARSLSVGFLRMMEARDDFTIYHEPSTAPFDLIHFKEYYDKNILSNSFHSYEEMTQAILDQAKKSNVFVKEVSFTCPDYLTQDHPFLQSARFAFLVRKPQDVILSFYQKGTPLFAIQKLAGFQQLHALFELVENHAKHPPFLIFSEDVAEHPAETVASFCQAMQIAFKPESLSWQDLGEHFSGESWHEGKKQETVSLWHSDAIRSTGFVPLRTSEVDADGNPTFAEVENLQDRAACLEIYHNCLPYYQAIKAKWSAKQ